MTRIAKVPSASLAFFLVFLIGILDLFFVVVLFTFVFVAICFSPCFQYQELLGNNKQAKVIVSWEKHPERLDNKAVKRHQRWSRVSFSSATSGRIADKQEQLPDLGCLRHQDKRYTYARGGRQGGVNGWQFANPSSMMDDSCKFLTLVLCFDAQISLSYVWGVTYKFSLH